MEEQLQSLEGVNQSLVCFNNGVPFACSGQWNTQYGLYSAGCANSVMYELLANIRQKQFKYALIENRKGRQILAPIRPLSEKNKDLKIILYGHANKSVSLRQLIESVIECVKDIAQIVTAENVQLTLPSIDNYDPSILINLLKCNNKDFYERINEIPEIEKEHFLRRYSSNIKLEFEELIKSTIESIPRLKSIVISLKNGYIIKKYGKESSIPENDIEFLSEKARLFLCSANNWSILKDETKITSCFIEYDTFYHFVYNLSRSRVDFIVEKVNVKVNFLEQIFEEYEINSMKLEKSAEKIDSLANYVLKPFFNLKSFKESSNKNTDFKEKIAVKEP